jgi:putative membrane protein
MPALTTFIRRAALALLAIYLFTYPFSIVLVALDRVPVWGTWMGGALLILLGTLTGLWLFVNYGRAGAVASAAILFLAWLVEHVGATTGFPFGTYSYTEVLQPQIIDVVPLAIPFAWLLIVTASVAVADRVLSRHDPRHAPRPFSVTGVLTAASFALLLDITIEPFAVYINNYWVWSGAEPGAYYGIPLSNFIAWWVTGLLLSGVLLLARQRVTAPQFAPAAFLPHLPVWLYLSNLTMFVVVNLARGQVLAAQIGALVMLAIAGDWLLPRIARRLRRAAESGS